MLLYLFQIFSLLIINSTSIKLYNTEDALRTQSYDCIYYTNLTARNNETIPYCIRTNEQILLSRLFTKNMCENSGKEWSFKSLKQMNISQDEVLTWNSSIEMADRYAAYLTTGNEQYANDKICNCSLKTFGKFCEYEFLTMNTFEETIQYQFNLKMKYRNGSQLWGNITCYTTLTNCYFGLRCLTWQNICDGKQQCMDGIDEDHCEELEYNECEENEYRCEDGSCTSEDYWLDGQYDCSDQTDEQILEHYIHRTLLCPIISSQFNCDETINREYNFACGDGEFKANELLIINTCYNYRNLMFFCEYPSYGVRFSYQTLWTLENGHCIDKDIIQKNLTDMNELEICIFYLKCKLTNLTTVGCDDIIHFAHSLCQNKTIHYPLGPVFKPYAQSLYDLSNVRWLSEPDYTLLNGSMKCIGYQSRFLSNTTIISWNDFRWSFERDTDFCSYSENKNPLGPQIDANCWNATKQSFRCPNSLQCISKYRLRNGLPDCYHNDDEDDYQQCYMKHKHRFHCPEESSICLLVSALGDKYPSCPTDDDENIPQLKWNLPDYKCTTPNSIECNVLKTYVQSRLLLLTKEVLLFRQYCNTLWELPHGHDESICNQWKCPKDEYQCLSGHCIPLVYVIKPSDRSWHCPDASDNIGFLRITNLSEHNRKLIDNYTLQKIKNIFIEYNNNSLFVSFTTYCHAALEYGCILANVIDPLNFTINRPCINLTQIGDGIIDCYGGLDERNLLSCGNNISEQRGFDFHCNEKECIPFHQHCQQRCSNNADNLLCIQLQTLWNSSCQYPTREQTCVNTNKDHCDLFDVGKYYCDITRRDQNVRARSYRTVAWKKRNTWIYLPEYPIWKDNIVYHKSQTLLNNTTDIYSNISREQENNGQEGWICSRGVAMENHQTNTIQCFCPSSLYGEYCQYFSDRITVITSFNNISIELLEEQSNTIKILALLLSNDQITDHHIFHLPLILSKELNKKFRFNLIHQRPTNLSNLYKIRFQAYYLAYNLSIKFLNVWEYPIKFPFLPSYRFAQILTFEKNSTITIPEHICKKHHPCLHNSTCYPIMNKINDTLTYYCHCNNQTFGKQCQYHLQSMISSTCSKHALLYPLSSLKSICLWSCWEIT